MVDITNFANSLVLHRPSKYTVEFIGAPVPIVQQGMPATTAESVTFPGRGIASVERRTFGPLREMPYERLYTGDVEIVFAHDVEYTRSQLEQWMDKIISPEDVINPEYFKYAAEIRISIESETTGTMSIGNLPSDDMVVCVREAWPKSINPIQLSYGMVDEYVKMSVSFSFREVVYGCE
jgi:hypothetical protein